MGFPGHRHIVKPDGSSDNSWLAYTCAYCGTKVTGAVVAIYQNDPVDVRWLLCPNCTEGSVKSRGRLSPGPEFGPKIDGLPTDVAAAYGEARRCMQVTAYTAAELICRKILMHVAVDKGAPEGESFANYLSFLESKGYITPPMKGWVDLIRKSGNDATHRIAAPARESAESNVMFTAELLRLVYEMESMAAKYGSSPS